MRACIGTIWSDSVYPIRRLKADGNHYRSWFANWGTEFSRSEVDRVWRLFDESVWAFSGIGNLNFSSPDPIAFTYTHDAL
jgi:hypothetical protein